MLAVAEAQAAEAAPVVQADLGGRRLSEAGQTAPRALLP